MQDKFDIKFPLQIDDSLIRYLKSVSKNKPSELSEKDTRNIKKLVEYEDADKNNFLHLYIKYIFEIDLKKYYPKNSRVRILCFILYFAKAFANRGACIINTKINTKNKDCHNPFEILIQSLKDREVHNSAGLKVLIYISLAAGAKLKVILENENLHSFFVSIFVKNKFYTFDTEGEQELRLRKEAIIFLTVFLFISYLCKQEKHEENLNTESNIPTLKQIQQQFTEEVELLGKSFIDENFTCKTFENCFKQIRELEVESNNNLLCMFLQHSSFLKIALSEDKVQSAIESGAEILLQQMSSTLIDKSIFVAIKTKVSYVFKKLLEEVKLQGEFTLHKLYDYAYYALKNSNSEAVAFFIEEMYDYFHKTEKRINVRFFIKAIADLAIATGGAESVHTILNTRAFASVSLDENFGCLSCENALEIAARFALMDNMEKQLAKYSTISYKVIRWFAFGLHEEFFKASNSPEKHDEVKSYCQMLLKLISKCDSINPKDIQGKRLFLLNCNPPSAIQIKDWCCCSWGCYTTSRLFEYYLKDAINPEYKMKDSKDLIEIEVLVLEYRSKRGTKLER